MIGRETHEVERKILAMLDILSDSKEPLGGRIISRYLKEKGIDLSERAVRYHLKIMDERGYTRCVGQRDGREITPPGLEELHNALVCDKLGLLIRRIELLAYLTTFDLNTRTGDIPIDVSLVAAEDLAAALEVMRGVFKAGFCISDRIATVSSGEKLGEMVVPKGKIGIATVSSTIISGLLLKSGIPIDPRFAGIVQIHDFKPDHFVELIEYHGSTVHPLEIFITSKMTSVSSAVREGEGKILASFYEIPMFSRPATEAILKKLKEINLSNFFIIGKTAELIDKVPKNSNKLGLVLFSGLNPVAAAAEEGINVINKAMSGVMNASKLRRLQYS